MNSKTYLLPVRYAFDRTAAAACTFWSEMTKPLHFNRITFNMRVFQYFPSFFLLNEELRDDIKLRSLKNFSKRRFEISIQIRFRFVKCCLNQWCSYCDDCDIKNKEKKNENSTKGCFICFRYRLKLMLVHSGVFSVSNTLFFFSLF